MGLSPTFHRKFCHRITYAPRVSRIRSIRQKKAEICGSVDVSPTTSKMVSQVRDKVLLKTEKDLNVWLQDMSQKHIPIDSRVIREKALSIYDHYSKELDESGKKFKASKGWLANFVKRYSLTLNRNLAALDANPDYNITIADRIPLISEAVNSLKPETLNACWKSLWSEVVIDSINLTTIDGEVRNILTVDKEVGGDGFSDIIQDDSEELIEEPGETLTNKEVKDLLKGSEKDVEETEPAGWTFEKLAEVLRLCQVLKDMLFEFDPSMERCIQINLGITAALQPIQDLFDSAKRKRKERPITMLFTKAAIEKPPPSTTESPQASATAPDVIHKPPLKRLCLQSKPGSPSDIGQKA